MKQTLPALILISTIFIFADVVISFRGVREVVLQGFAPLEYGMYNVGQSLYGVGKFATSLPGVYVTNEKLKEEIKELLVYRVESEVLRKENEALRAQLKVQGVQERERVLARVLGDKVNGGAVFLLIDHGSEAKIRKGSVVHIDSFLVGKVVEVSEHQSVVETIFSSGSRVPVRVGETAEGLLRGELGIRVQADEILQEEEINVDDLVVTLGADGIYPPNLIIGKVKEVVRADNKLFKIAKINPAWHLNELSVVFVNSE